MIPNDLIFRLFRYIFSIKPFNYYMATSENGSAENVGKKVHLENILW